MANKNQDRRNFICNLGLTVSGGALTAAFNIVPKPKVNKEQCTATPILEMGPYAVMQYRKQADHDIDLKQITSNAGIASKKDQLFITLSFYPTIEMEWTAKDEFECWSFSNTYIKFTREDKGKVIGLRLHFDEDRYVEATKNRNH